MNKIITSVGVIAITAFALYITGNAYALLALLILVLLEE